jgi:hypothetical protein
MLIPNLVWRWGLLQLVKVVGKVRKFDLESLAFSCVHDDGVGLGADLHWVSGHDLPMVKDALGEGLSSGVGAKVSGETCAKKLEKSLEA